MPHNDAFGQSLCKVLHGIALRQIAEGRSRLHGTLPCPSYRMAACTMALGDGPPPVYGQCLSKSAIHPGCCEQ